MAIERSYEIIKALAEGTNPFTGEVLEPGHVCQHPDTVRALFHAATELERLARRERSLQRARLTMPENTGKPWSLDEDRMLLTRHRNGIPVEDMAAIHSRTANAIRARLEKLGQSGEGKAGASHVQPPAASERRN